LKNNKNNQENLLEMPSLSNAMSVELFVPIYAETAEPIDFK